MHLGPERVERSTEKRWHSYGKCVSAKRDIVLADQPKRMDTVSACIRIAKCMTHVRGSLIQKADVRRPMQAQVESTTTSANAKHWKLPAEKEATERLNCFSTPSARSAVQNAAPR